MNKLWESQINTNSGMRHPRVCRDSILSSFKKLYGKTFFLFFDVWFIDVTKTFIRVFEEIVRFIFFFFFDRQRSCNFLSNFYDISHLKVSPQHFGTSKTFFHEIEKATFGKIWNDSHHHYPNYYLFCTTNKNWKKQGIFAPTSIMYRGISNKNAR